MYKALFLVPVALFFIAVAAQAETFVATDVPMAIPDGPSGIARSYLMIPVNRQILDLDITVTITHPFTGDLGLYLEEPGGETTVRLAYRVGHSGDNFTGTTFDDEAAVSINDGNPPYSGRFIPDRPLSALDGLGTFGTWIFRVTDNAPNDVGTIQAWQLEITLGDTLAAREPGAWRPVALTLAASPNPFNPTTRLSFSLASPGTVKLMVFDMTGRQVKVLADGPWTAGHHVLTFDASGLPSGPYLASIQTAGLSQTTRLLLVK